VAECELTSYKAFMTDKVPAMQQRIKRLKSELAALRRG
jgi:hypothetical protein